MTEREDPTETSAGEAGGREAMSAADETRAALASSSKRTRFGRLFVEHLLAECDAATERAVKAERQLSLSKSLSARYKWQRDQARTELAELRHNYEVARTAQHEQWERAVRAEQKLAELRERIGEERVGWGVQVDGDDDAEVAEDEDDARWKVGFRNSGFTTISPHRVVKRVVGEWKAAEDGQ